MTGFVVVEVSVTKTSFIVMQSESELLCYRQALALQKITSNCDYEDEIYYEVIPEEDFNV